MGGEPIDARGEPRRPLGLHALRRRKDEPFIHALDTVKREAYCIGLPVRRQLRRPVGLRLEAPRAQRALTVRNGGTRLAHVDTDSWKVERAS